MVDHDLVKIQSLDVVFNNVQALRDVTFSISRERIHGLIGPNGAGKTTLINAFSRLVSYQKGDILLNGQSLSKRKPHQMAAMGLGRTFQHLVLYNDLNVMENLLVGGYSRGTANALACGLRLSSVDKEEKVLRLEASDILRLLELWDNRNAPIWELSLTLQKRIEIGRALMQKPVLLLLDEPAAGLTQHEVTELIDLIRTIRVKCDVTIVIVEHHMRFITSLCDDITVLNYGRVIASGSPSEIRNSKVVRDAYLGGV